MFVLHSLVVIVANKFVIKNKSKQKTCYPCISIIWPSYKSNTEIQKELGLSTFKAFYDYCRLKIEIFIF